MIDTRRLVVPAVCTVACWAVSFLSGYFYFNSNFTYSLIMPLFVFIPLLANVSYDLFYILLKKYNVERFTTAATFLFSMLQFAFLARQLKPEVEFIPVVLFVTTSATVATFSVIAVLAILRTTLAAASATKDAAKSAAPVVAIGVVLTLDFIRSLLTNKLTTISSLVGFAIGFFVPTQIPQSVSLVLESIIIAGLAVAAWLILRVIEHKARFFTSLNASDNIYELDYFMKFLSFMSFVAISIFAALGLISSKFSF